MIKTFVIFNKMRSVVVLLGAVLALVAICESKDLIVGTSFNNRLLWQQKAEYNAIPLKKRVKEVFYSDPGQQIIKVFFKHFFFIRTYGSLVTCFLDTTAEAKDFSYNRSDGLLTTNKITFFYFNLLILITLHNLCVLFLGTST